MDDVLNYERINFAMNLICFDNLKKNLLDHNQRITDVLKDYRAEVERVTGIYTSALADEKVERARDEARRAIVAADLESREAAQRSLDVLRNDLSEETAISASPALLARLQTAKMFDMKVGRLELEAMIKEANGDNLTLTALAEIARKSNYLLEFTPISALEDDLKKISNAFPESCSFAPMEYLNEAAQLLPDVIHHGVNYGRPTGTHFAMAAALAESNLKYIDAARDRWANRKKATLTPIVLPQNL